MLVYFRQFFRSLSCSWIEAVVRKALFTFLFAILLSPLVCTAQEQQPDADVIRRAKLETRSYAYGKELEYRIDVLTFNSPGGSSFFSLYPDVSQQGVRKLAIGQPVRGRSYIPSRLMHFQENEGEPHTDENPLLTFFQGFDGRVTNTYVRRLLADHQIKTGIHSDGTQQVGCSIDAFKADPMVKLLFNRMEPFQGLPLEEYEFVPMGDQLKTERTNHPADENAIRMSTTDPDDDFYVIVSSAPEYLLLEKRVNYPDGPLTVEITELTNFEGNRYPSRGTYRELTRDGKFGWEASVELLGIEAIDVNKTDWLPPWPVGTDWKREKDLKHFEVPFSREQIKKIQAVGLNNARNATFEGSSAFYYVNILLLLIILGLGVYKFWPREGTGG